MSCYNNDIIIFIFTGVKCFGPSAKAAQIEASKDFAKKFMERHSIPTACYRSFQDADSACEHINRQFNICRFKNALIAHFSVVNQLHVQLTKSVFAKF